MPSETSIQCFVAAGQYCSFSKAADALYMTRQAVSRQIAVLEKELGAKLFERTTSHVKLTPVGEIYFDYFLDATHRWERVRQQARKAQEAQVNTVRIGCLHDAELGGAVFAAVEECRRKGFSIQVDWERQEPQELMNLLLSEKLDIVFVFARAQTECRQPDQIDSFWFRSTNAVLAVNKDHPLAARANRPEDFCRETCFISERMTPQTPNHLTFSEEWALVGLHFRDVQIMSNRETMQNMVELGRGVTICSDIDRFAHRPDIATFPIGHSADINCFWRKEEQRPQILALLRELRQKAG